MTLPAETPDTPSSTDDALRGDELAEVRAERDALKHRVAEAEAIAEQLAEELGQARARLSEAREVAAPDPQRLPLFDDAVRQQDGSGRAANGSDPILLPIALGATAVVAFLIALLSLANNGFGSIVSIGAMLGSFALGWAAWRTRVVPVDVYVEKGIVHVEKGDAELRFDLTNKATRIEVVGRPGDSDWLVRFYRRALDPCDIDASMVDPERFLARLREYRPEL